MVTWKNKFHFTDWNQVFTEATIVSNDDPLASFVFYVPSMFLMYEPADSIDSTIFIYLVNSRGQSVSRASSKHQMNSVLKEDVKIFADYKLMILCLNF